MSNKLAGCPENMFAKSTSNSMMEWFLYPQGFPVTKLNAIHKTRYMYKYLSEK